AGACLVTCLLHEPIHAPRWRDYALRIAQLPRRLWWLGPVGLAAVLFALTSALAHPDKSQGMQAGVIRFSPKLFLARELPAWLHDFWRSRGDDLGAAVLWL